MRIPHGHFDIGVTKHSLQNQNISAIHHEVRRECVAQYMR